MQLNPFNFGSIYFPNGAVMKSQFVVMHPSQNIAFPESMEITGKVTVPLLLGRALLA